MKFGQHLQEEIIAEFRANYIDYEGLKGVLRATPVDEEQFKESIEQELKKLDYFTLGKVTELVNWIAFLDRTASDPTTEEEIASVCERAVKLELFLHQNMEGIRKILKKYVKHTGYSIVWFSSMRRQSHLYSAYNIMHELAVQISRVVQKRQDAGGRWEPPSSFNRKNTKFWVKAENIFALKVFLLQRLPILEINESDKVDLDFKQRKFSQIHNYISSVYFDSPDLCSYHGRITKQEGAELIRIRWYGGKLQHEDDTFPVPSDTEPFVFMERKTHHEVEDSVKERFQLKRKHVPAFLAGTLDIDAVLDKMVEKKQLQPRKLEDARKLAHEMMASITTKDLRPVCRTVYHRTAFQSSTSNAVRMSLDFPLFLYPESDIFAKESTIENFSEFFGSLKGPKSYTPFPFGVLELKTQGDPPEWVNELLATGWLIELRFSKFQHAVVANYPHLVKVVPAWLSLLENMGLGAHTGAGDHGEHALEEEKDKKGKTKKTGGGDGHGSAEGGAAAASYEVVKSASEESRELPTPAAAAVPPASTALGASPHPAGSSLAAFQASQAPIISSGAGMTHSAAPTPPSPSTVAKGGKAPDSPSGGRKSSALRVSFASPAHDTAPPGASSRLHGVPEAGPLSKSALRASGDLVPMLPHGNSRGHNPPGVETTGEVGSGKTSRRPTSEAPSAASAGHLPSSVDKAATTPRPSRTGSLSAAAGTLDKLASTPRPSRSGSLSTGGTAAAGGGDKASSATKGAGAGDKDKGKRPSAGTFKPVISKVKIEPKTFFANERTFLKWMQLSVLLVALSTGLLAIDDDRTRLAGTLFFPIAIFFSLYAVILFLWRLRILLIQGTGSSNRFDEPYGPTFFGVCVAAALIATLFLEWVPASNYVGPPQGMSYAESSTCRQYLPLSSDTLATSDTSVSIVMGISPITPGDQQRQLLGFEIPSGMAWDSNTTSLWLTVSHRLFQWVPSTGALYLSATFNGQQTLNSVTYIPAGVVGNLPRLVLAQGSSLTICTVAPPINPNVTLAANVRNCAAWSNNAPTTTKTAYANGALFSDISAQVQSSFGSSIAVHDAATLQEQQQLVISMQAVQSSADALNTAVASGVQRTVSSFKVTAASLAIGGMAAVNNHLFVLLPTPRILVVMGLDTGSYSAFALPGSTTVYTSLAVTDAQYPSSSSSSPLITADRNSTYYEYSVFLGQPFPTGIQRFTLNLNSGFLPCCITCSGLFSLGV